MYLEYKNYRDILRAALRERQEANPLYSMTALARDLGVTAGMLSLVLRGQRGISRAVAERAATLFKFGQEESEYFLSLVEAAHARSPKARQIAYEVMQKYDVDEKVRSLQVDAFRVISDWYHFAILELMKLSEFESTSDWIADQLSIDTATVEAALSRLSHLELIEQKNGEWELAQDAVFTSEGVPSIALRKFHRQVMDRATRALEEQSLDERYVNSTLLAVDEKDLPLARQKIKEFHLDLMKTLGTASEPTRVYGVSVQFFAVSKPSLKTTKESL